MDLHRLLDVGYGVLGNRKLRKWLGKGANVNARKGPLQETPLHVASRRRRLSAVKILVENGAEVEAKTVGDKTALVHAARRGFNEVVDYLMTCGSTPRYSPADRLAVALSCLDENLARKILAEYPNAAHTGNPEEDRLLADMAGRNVEWPVSLLIGAGASLLAPGLDGGTPLHQAAWFGQPHNVRLLLQAEVPLEVFDGTHHSSPLGWAVHGSKFSGDAGKRQKAYTDIVQTLLTAGASLYYQGDTSDAYYRRLLHQGSKLVRAQLRAEYMNRQMIYDSSSGLKAATGQSDTESRKSSFRA